MAGGMKLETMGVDNVGVAPPISASHAWTQHESSFLHRDPTLGEQPPGLGTVGWGSIASEGGMRRRASELSRANARGDAVPPSGVRGHVQPWMSILFLFFCSR